MSRDEWDARPPECADLLNKSKVTLFIVHYSGASRDQSVRSIQDFCMDTKGHCDIDYNRIVLADYDYMGRGWNVGGHTKDHNSISYGVCMIGLEGDVTDADKRTIRGIYDEVCAELGRQLTMTTHRNVLGADYTDCPGDSLDAWVDAGMPLSEDDDMSYDRNTAWRLQGYLAGSTTITVPLTDTAGSPPEIVEPNMPQQQWDRIEQAVGKLTTPPPAEVDYAKLAEALRPIVAEESEKAVRAVLGGLDGATP